MLYRPLIIFFICISTLSYCDNFVLSKNKEIQSSSTRGSSYTTEELKKMRTEADEGDVKAATEYGYYLKLFTDKDEEAFKYWRKAAEKGYPRAMYWLIVYNDKKSPYYYELLKKMSETDEEARYWLEWLEE